MIVSTTAMIGAVVGYLAKKLKDNKSINDFFADFTNASVQWVRPVFLTDDAKPKEILTDLQEDPADKLNTDAVENALAKILKKDATLEKSLKEMYETIQSKTQSTPISIVNSKNVLVNSPIHAGGSITIGDVSTTNTYPNFKP
jgi:hypothetical protein